MDFAQIICERNLVMKKILASLMALTLALSLAACGETETTNSSEAPSQTPSTPVSSVKPSEPIAPPSIEEEISLNLALKGTAIADGDKDGFVISNLNDGNLSSRWAAAAKDPETEDNVSWFGISWDEAQTFDTMFVLWEQAHPLENGFRVEISDDGENWTEVEFTAVRGGIPDETLTGGLKTDKQTDDITLSEVVTTKNVRIVAFTHYIMPDNAPEYAGDPKNPTSAYEFEIYNSADLEAEEGGETASEEAESTDETVAE